MTLTSEQKERFERDTSKVLSELIVGVTGRLSPEDPMSGEMEYAFVGYIEMVISILEGREPRAVDLGNREG